ncbi:uncharacterized protein [Primulina eburnea]|uniref:uncharacterized protein n=1 Tax=Primulina eburnea TaxID=1245227 RepID=UPI003C6C7024
MVIGGCMFPYSRGGGVSLMYLQLLHNIPRVSRYSWGSAVLSFLYQELCKSSIIGRKIICGPLLILQVWAWSMMTSISPNVHGFCHIVSAPPDVNDNNYDTILPIAPYGARWARHFSHTHTSTHSVRIIREILDLMEDGQFNWTVYDFEALDVQAFIKGHQGEIWRCDEEATTLINRFGGLNVHEQSREALEEAIQDDWRIGRHFRDALNRVSNEEEVQHDIPRRNSFQNREECSRRRRRESGSSSSSDSHQHRTPHGCDVPGTSHGHYMHGPSRVHEMSGPLHQPSAVYNVDYRPLMQYGFHTPDVASSVSLTELLNSEHRQFDNEVRSFYHEMRPNYLSSPIPFHGFSATSSSFAPDNLNRDRNTETDRNTEMETEHFNLRRSVRVRIPHGCGTGHFYYY